MKFHTPPRTGQGWRMAVILLSAVLLLALPQFSFAEDSGPVYRVLISSPAVTRHSGDGQYKDFHPGFGIDVQVSPDKDSPWNFAVGGYNMDEDSHGRPMWWGGFTTSYTIGDRGGWWVEPGMLAGVIHKREIYRGEPCPFALPSVGIGYGYLGVVGSYIPATSLTNNVSIGIAMLRLTVPLNF